MTEGTNNFDGKDLKVFVCGLALGALVGGAVALLYAPMKGEDTRRMLKQKAEELEDKASDVLSSVEQTAAKLKKRGDQPI
jgi:gas vesicle protein